MGPPSEEHQCDWQAYARQLEREKEELLDELQELATDNVSLLESKEKLEQQLGKQKKHRYGQRSEKSKRTKPKKPELTKEQKEERRKRKLARRKKNRQSRANLPTEEKQVKVPEEGLVCEHCGEFARFSEVKNGAKETQVLERNFAALVRLIYRRQKLRCACSKTFIEAPVPPRAFPESEYGPNFVADILVKKVLDCLPFYRLKKALFREGLVINDNTLGQLFHKAAIKLEPIYDRLRAEVKESWLILADESVLKYLNPRKPEKNGASRGYVWCFLAPENSQVVYQFDTSRAGAIPEELLKETSGILLCDGYSGYNVVVNSYDRERAGCLVHARRKFFELLESDKDLVTPILAEFSVIYKVEIDAAGLEDGLGSSEHLDLRRSKSLPALEKIKELCEQRPPELLANHRVSKAMNYFLNQWPHLTKFIENARIPADNNYCERMLRIIALLRKNSLFVGNPESGQRTMVILSLAQSCVLSGINPTRYFSDVLLRVNDPDVDLEELLPSNWKPPPKEITA